MIYIYEAFMIIIHAFCFLTWMINFASFSTTFLTMLLLSCQYYIISIASTKIQDTYDEIGTSLYSAKWYWMSGADRKMMLQIMTVAAKTKTLCVWIFGESNLERFTDVSNFCLIQH